MTDPSPLNAALDSHERWLKLVCRFKLSCMSDTKWRKVLRAIAESGVKIRRCELKCIDSDFISVQDRAPLVSELLEKRFTDSIWQPFEYKWIEWFRFPRQIKPYPGVGFVIEQDIEALRTVIEAAAQACIELDDEYLWLYGYR